MTAPNIDLDLIEAREIVKTTLFAKDHSRCACRSAIDAGDWDSFHKVRAALAAIKRGRQLAGEGK